MEGKDYRFTISGEQAGQRLDKVVSELFPEVSRSTLKARQVNAEVNGKGEKWSYKTHTGDGVFFHLPPLPSYNLEPQEVDFTIIYSDEHVAVINKPWGLTVHPAKGHEEKTLVNGLLFHWGKDLSRHGGEDRPGIVHRLDKDTAGLMVVALTEEAHRKLAEDFQERRVKKIYHAIVKGHISPEEGTIELPVGRSDRDRKKMAVSDKGRPALTEYRVIRYLREHSYVEAHILTGRTHQIRVHFSHLGHPVAGDPVYSRNTGKYGLPGIALCAKRLEFRHPADGREMKFEIELPEEMDKLLRELQAE